jgi:UDP-N-acetylglucosamine--N-acetylmuramyl-(pentapeptide) pyrophosphoryl-undecaprenol N-acetylglucosamine transferase
MAMRMVIAGGGTGGHFFPGLAVAQEAVAGDGTAVLFIGSDEGIEARAAPRHGFAFVPVRMRPFRGGGIAGVVRSLVHLPRAMAVSWRALRRFRPDVVIGLGSYGSVPVVLAAWCRRIPVVLMEQNVVPGFANRLLGRFARRVCTTFAESAAFFPAGRSVQTGNPVRTLQAARTPEPGQFTVFAFGGSQGARSINRAMVAAARELRPRLPGLRIVHQTGAADAAEVAAGYREIGLDAEVHAFIDDMASAYGRADLVVSRAGASTLAEIAALAKPAILIPYPVAADDHQRKNADVVVRRGAALMILDRDLSGTTLAAAIAALAADAGRRQEMAAAVHGFAVPDAALQVLRICRDAVAEGR